MTILLDHAERKLAEQEEGRNKQIDMAHKLSSVPKAPTGSFPPVLRLLDTYFSSTDPLPQKQRCLDLMVVYLKNIYMNNSDPKFRSIRLRNPRFQREIMQCAGSDLVFLAIGFVRKVKDFEEYFILPDSVDISTEYWRVKEYQEKMTNAIAADKNAPINMIKAEQAAKEVAIRQIEEDARQRRAKAKRALISSNTLSDHDTGAFDRQRVERQEARLQALNAPIAPAATMLPTPSLAHIKEDHYEHVYEPAEDSFALLDALQNDTDLLRDIDAYPLVLEIGTGSGIVTTFLQQSIFPQSLHLCTDINHLACLISEDTSNHNVSSPSTLQQSVRTSLVDGLRIRDVDLIVFNPPYVPTQQEEIDLQGSIAAAWAGGIDGMDVTSVLLPQISGLLSENGLFYLVTVARNKPKEILKSAQDLGLDGRIVLERRAGREKLAILRFWKMISVQTSQHQPELSSVASASNWLHTDVQPIKTESRRMNGTDPANEADKNAVEVLD